MTEETSILQDETSEELYERKEFTIDKGQEPIRVDKWLQARIEGATRNKIQKGIEAGFLTVNNKIVKSILDKHLEKKVLAEKTEAVAIWKQIEALSNQLDMKDSVSLEAIRVSCTYGRIKFSLIEQMWIMMIEDGNFKLKGEMNKDVVKKAIKKYDDLWVEWRLLKESSSQCATLYTDKASMDKREGSIGELVDKLREMVK